MNEYLASDQFLTLAKRFKDSGDFSRRRKLPLPKLIVLMISGMTSSVLLELTRFFEGLYPADQVTKATPAPSSFSRARRKLHAGVFGHLNEAIVSKWLSLVPIKRWSELRLVAVDGTALRFSVPGKSHRVNDVADRDWRALSLYLPEHELTLHAQLYKGDVCERQILVENLERLEPDDLVLLDRGYPASWLINCLNETPVKFVMRIDRMSFTPVKRFAQSGVADAVVTLKAPTKAQCELYECGREAPRVRLVRCMTKDGQVRILATNLLDSERYPTDAMHDLYHNRWRIEEAFKRQKHRLKVEAATGVSEQAVRQDFMAKMVADNLARIIAHRHDQKEEQKQEPGSKRTNINRTLAIDLMKSYLPELLVRAWDGSRAQLVIERMTEALGRTRRAIVEGRSYPRPARPKPHAKSGYKT